MLKNIYCLCSARYGACNCVYDCVCVLQSVPKAEVYSPIAIRLLVFFLSSATASTTGFSSSQWKIHSHTHAESCATKRGLISDYRRCLAVSVQTTTWSAGVIKYSASWTTIRALVSVTQTAPRSPAPLISLKNSHWWFSPLSLSPTPPNLTHITISI